ncbi:hypothetical protein C2E19_15155 [Pseudomonas sp. DTU12.3]|jgi:peptidoglycan/LPS O-acetylase OafA/YrhL|uniref:DUF4190 domain-containing protein n=1 Tax=unclassified Pseudomonas TaxID=196821 RepID=UPI000CFF8B38|nr:MULTISPECIES: DUF4190 domain-containing protein [unclassified Pseudomonas]PRB50882.1 hypothetical protein CQ025_07930 [Pseudomonas sp. MYb3]PRC34260.1 hypothetical protein CQ009_11285 [Pseudomonas sp. MYb2]QAX85108.1 hypothetical protein C2E19_15155 [Pseudomonas sp. DTU12.3]
MAMVYCRACAKELHETALSCPQCGASQQAFVPQTQAEVPWLAIVSMILGIICALTLFDDSEWDAETILGVGFISIAGLACGIICINQKHSGRNLAIAGIILSGLTALVLLCLSIE